MSDLPLQVLTISLEPVWKFKDKRFFATREWPWRYGSWPQIRRCAAHHCGPADASASYIGLQGFYLSFVLDSWKRGLGFAALLSGLYAVLYGLLLSEDNALILGSILLFAILAAIMVLTRRIDWYAVGDAWQPLPDAPATSTAQVPAANTLGNSK